MTILGGDEETQSRLSTGLGYVPVTVLGFAGISGALAVSGVYATGGENSPISLFNPLYYVLSLFLHGDWAHYQSNMTAWIPFGIVFTLLTSNRHVFGIAVLSHVLMTVVSAALLRPIAGMSGAVFAVIAATLVRSTGYALQNASLDTLQTAVTGLLGPALAGLFLITLLAGNSPIGHFEHFTAFLFGGAIEAMYVFGRHDTDGDERRRIPRRIGR